MQVFADHNSSLNPIDVPRDWIWNLRRRTVYFGTSIPTIFKGNNFKRDGLKLYMIDQLMELEICSSSTRFVHGRYSTLLLERYVI